MSDRQSEPPPAPIWDIYPAVERAIRLGDVEAADEAEAIENAAEKFEQDPTMLNRDTAAMMGRPWWRTPLEKAPPTRAVRV